MKKVLVILLAAVAWRPCLSAKELLEIKGDYLLYSYDHNYVYSQGAVQLRSAAWTIRAGVLEVDVLHRVARAARGCRVEAAGRSHEADLLEIDLETLALRLTVFEESVRSWSLPGGRKSGKETAAGIAPFTAIDLEALRKSLVYFLNRRIVITPGYGVYGYGSTAFIEGVQSLSFKKFKLDHGSGTTNVEGAGIDKIWYTSSQGAVVNGHLTLEKPLKKGAAKTANSLNLKYDILNRGVPPRAKVYFTSGSSLDLSRRISLGLSANFITGNMFSAVLALRNQWTPRWSSELAAEYSRNISGREETWLRLRSGLQEKVLGQLQLSMGVERRSQYQAEISLQNQAVKNVTLSLRHSLSRLLFDEQSTNRLRTSGFSLAYSHRLFQMAADYSFHKDLLHEQSQGTPRFTLAATPFRLYHGLLLVNFTSSFTINRLNLAGQLDEQRQANLALSLQSETVRLGGGPGFSVALAAEQLLERQRPDQFTSLGGIFKCSQAVGTFADLDFLYNYHTRRRTEAWFVQGSTSQDWSAVLRLKEGSQRLKGWVSVSYDSKAGNFTSGFLDVAVSLVKNWQVQTQMNYDFLFRNFNYDLYLIRLAGRIMVRASYRSLSRKFLLEILPR
ncbi:MAG: hypothetical protein JXO51_11780 [Candidatus Aminicenantes bacterium]|nr:hypothetical protein [Candidatus Aminicenantes bacterium]